MVKKARVSHIKFENVQKLRESAKKITEEIQKDIPEIKDAEETEKEEEEEDFVSWDCGPFLDYDVVWTPDDAKKEQTRVRREVKVAQIRKRWRKWRIRMEEHSKERMEAKRRQNIRQRAIARMIINKQKFKKIKKKRSKRLRRISD